MSDDRPPAYYEDEVLILRASAFWGGCMWELAAAAQEYPPLPFPDALLKAFDDGNRLEPVIIEHMKQWGWEFSSHQTEGELMITPTLKIRYHSDGLAFNREGVEFVVECKALGPDLWDTAARHGVQSTIPHYAGQLSVMMHAEDKPGVWCAYNKETEQYHTQLVQYPLINLGDIRARALDIQKLVEQDDIVDSGRPCDRPEHWPCLYRHIRPEGDELTDGGGDRLEDRPEELHADEDLAEKLDQAARKYLQAKGMADETAQRLNEAKAELLALVPEGIKKVQTGRFTIPVFTSYSTKPDWSKVSEAAKAEIDAAKVKKPTGRYVKDVKGS